MKKFILILLLMSVLAGCSSGDTSLVAVISDGEKIPVYTELHRDETGISHVPFYERLDEVKDQIPVITWREGMSMEVSDHYECWGIIVFDISGERIANLADLSELPSINGGEYYFRAYVVEQRANETREYNGYNCVFRMTIPDLDPLITVISNGEETVAPKYWYCSMSWNEDGENAGWLFADGMGIYDDLEETCANLPEVRMSSDFSLRYGENVTQKSTFSIYGEDFEEIGWSKDPEELKTLESGTYYIVMNVFRNDTEMHEGETGYNGYHCGFKLTVFDGYMQTS